MNTNEQKAAIVTGASRGLGRALATRLAGDGWSVAMAARSADALDTVRDEIAGRGGNAIAIPADLTDTDARTRVADTTLERLGRVDLLINNAGAVEFTKAVDMNSDDIAHTIDLDLVAAMHLSQLATRQMLAQGSGKIVNISTVLTHTPLEYVSVYGAAKAGIEYFTAALRRELRGTGISAMYVSLGGISDDGMMNSMEERTGAKMGRAAGMAAAPVDKVARQVLKAVQRDRLETLAAPGGGFIKRFPRLARSMLSTTGATDFMREVSEVDAAAGRTISRT